MIIDGRKIAKDIEIKLKEKFSTLSKKRVCFIVFENSSVIEQFVKMKTKVGKRIGVECVVRNYEGELTTEKAVEFVQSISIEGFDGIVIQLPLPVVLNTEEVLNSIPLELDIDALAQNSSYVAPVALAVDEIFKYCKINLQEKKIVILGEGRLVGAPIARYFAKQNIVHKVLTEKTEAEEYARTLKDADVVISGIGKPHFINPTMIKPDVILIDAGTSEQNGKIKGDVDPLSYDLASYYTPVPGGVGPLAVVSLFQNLIK